MVLVKTSKIFSTLFLSKKGLQIVLSYNLKRKNAFFDDKTKKNGYFPKGLTPAFGPKMAVFPTFFLGNIGQENLFYDILERKNAFLGYKNNKFKKSKN